MMKIRIGKAIAAMIKIVSMLTPPRSSAWIRLQIAHSVVAGASSAVFCVGAALADCEFTVWFAYDSVTERATK